MKTLHFSIIVIFTLGISSAYADSSTPIDGIVSMAGCNVIHGTISQTTDIQNTTIQICNYHERHFKLVEHDFCADLGFGMITDPKTGIAYRFAIACDIPSTCDPKDDWVELGWSHSEKLPVMVNGASRFIIITYSSNTCGSESYNPQEKKLTLIVDKVWKNQTKASAIIPKALVENIYSVKVNGQNVTPFVTDYPRQNAFPACPESCYQIDIPLTFSLTPEKIEIGAQSIPEFPLAVPILLISFVSVIVFYRIRIIK
jgi:hypothetical protein